LHYFDPETPSVKHGKEQAVFIAGHKNREIMVRLILESQQYPQIAAEFVERLMRKNYCRLLAF